MKNSSIAIVFAAALSLGACVSDQGDKQTLGTLIGAGLGGLAGSQIGSGTGQLAAVGAGVLLGGLLGNGSAARSTRPTSPMPSATRSRRSSINRPARPRHGSTPTAAIRARSRRPRPISPNRPLLPRIPADRQRRRRAAVGLRHRLPPTRRQLGDPRLDNQPLESMTPGGGNPARFVLCDVLGRHTW